jgi:hypothetical protein
MGRSNIKRLFREKIVFIGSSLYVYSGNGPIIGPVVEGWGVLMLKRLDEIMTGSEVAYNSPGEVAFGKAERISTEPSGPGFKMAIETRSKKLGENRLVELLFIA